MAKRMGLSFGAQSCAAVEARECADSVRSLLTGTGDEIEANIAGLPSGAMAVFSTGWEPFSDALARIPSDLVVYADALVEVDQSTFDAEQRIAGDFNGVFGQGG